MCQISSETTERNKKQNLCFERAIYYVKQGKRVRRAIWTRARRIELTGIILSESKKISEISNETCDNYIPTQEDMLANDWYIISNHEITQSKRGYMVSIENGTAPKYIHDNLHAAMIEATRIAGMPNNLGKTTYVLEIIKTITGKISTIVD